MKLIKHEIPANGKVWKVSLPFSGRVVSNERVTEQASMDDIHHIIIDLSGSEISYVEGQSIGVIPEGLDENGAPHKTRLYSICSARIGDDGFQSTVSIAVKRVTWLSETGETLKGVASNFLCDATSGTNIKITGPFGRHFLLPEDDKTNLIMVAVGTGIAPFRAFIHHIYKVRTHWHGKLRLFFGAKTKAELIYMNGGSSDIGVFVDLKTFKAFDALSREDSSKKIYVQDRISEQKEEIWPLIKEGNFAFYLCGLKGLETGVDQVLASWAAEDGLDWETMKAEFKAQGRYNIEVY